ncbi:MAG: DinB family protein [Actinomycetota bacterium]
MEAGPVAILRQQLQTTWSFAESALEGLTDEEALWCPSPDSWTVHLGDDGGWHADWSEPEPWPAPPTSIAWIQWHVIWWWSTVIDRSFGDGDLKREDVTWPGAREAMGAIDGLRRVWLDHLDTLTAADLAANTRSRWPYTDGRPFGLIVGWVNVELMKNVAEMSQLRRMTPTFADRT